jgi:hypothetical protein
MASSDYWHAGRRPAWGKDEAINVPLMTTALDRSSFPSTARSDGSQRRSCKCD